MSDDETPGVAFDAPTEWIYDTLVNRNSAAPGTSRGKLIDFFYGLKRHAAGGGRHRPQPLEDAFATYNDTVELMDAVFEPADCTPEGAKSTTTATERRRRMWRRR